MIIDPTQLLIFIPAALALNLTPGVDMMFCLGQGLKSGPKEGIAASFGIATGALIHTLMAGLGLAAVLATYPLAFEVLRWVGVGYLVWLALQAFRNPIGTVTGIESQADTAFKAWRDGVLVNLFNPKVAIFVLAFIPQFVDPARGSIVLQFLIFGVVLTIGGTIINALVGVFSGQIGKALASNLKMARAYQFFTGTIFLGLAAKLAFDRR